MSEQTLKFGDIVVNKREFHASKQAIALNLVNNLVNLGNILIMVEKICHLKLKMKVCIQNTLKSGIKLKSH